MGTCGIAAGSETILNAIKNFISQHNLKDIKLKQTGCLGLCYAEPTIKIILPGGITTIYGNLTLDNIESVLNSHIIENKIANNFKINLLCNNDLENIRTGTDNQQLRIVLRNCGKITPGDINDYIANKGYSALEKVLL